MCPARPDARSITREIRTAAGGIMVAGPRVRDLNDDPDLRGLAGVNRGNTGVTPTIHTRLDLAGDTR